MAIIPGGLRMDAVNSWVRGEHAQDMYAEQKQCKAIRRHCHSLHASGQYICKRKRNATMPVPITME